jgi:hypothetical protein
LPARRHTPVGDIYRDFEGCKDFSGSRVGQMAAFGGIQFCLCSLAILIQASPGDDLRIFNIGVSDLFSLSQYGELNNEGLIFDAAIFLMSLADFANTYFSVITRGKLLVFFMANISPNIF